MRVAGIILILLGALLVVMLGAMFSGVYNVAADGPRHPLRNWVLRMTMDNSVSHHAKGIDVPDLAAAGTFLLGFRHYDEMCVTCHGAPRVLPSEIGAGLNPHPPELTRVDDLKPAEIYWIVKHGIDMTGMPSFGLTHDEASLWAMTAFTLKLPKLTPMQYDSLRQVFRGVPSLEDDDPPRE